MRKLMWFSIGFAAACFLCAYLYAGWLTFVGIFACTLAALLLPGKKYFPVLRVAAMALFGFSVGIGWFFLYDGVYLSEARALDAQKGEFCFTAADYSYDTNYGCAVDCVLTVEGKPYRARVYLNEEKEISPGDTLKATFLLRFTAMGGSREATYHPGEGIYLLAYQRGKSLTHTPAKSLRLTDYPVVMRKSVTEKIVAIFPEDTAPFAKALLLGDKTDLDYETSTAFRVSGISHIVAVSGLHVSILFALVYLLTGKRRILSCVLGIPVLLCFAAMVGFTPSITRACLMQSLMLLAMATKQEYDPPTALAFAALVMLTGNPMVITSVSFQLSAGCIVGILLFGGRIREWLLARLGTVKGKGLLPRLKRGLASGVSVSISATVVTTPLVAWYFGTVSLLGILTNLLTVWIVAYIFYGILLCLGAGFFAVGLGKLIAVPVSIGIRFVLTVAKTIARIPFAASYTASPYTVCWLVFAYLLLLVFLLSKKKPVFVLVCCLILTHCLFTFAGWVEPLMDHCRVTVLDVGQGQCILLQSEGRTFLVDCGGNSDTESADVAAEVLLSQGICRVDGMIFTHYDRDHVGGAGNLLTRIGTNALYLPNMPDEDGIGAALEQAAGVPAVYVREDVTLRYGDTTVTIFKSELRNSGNNSGLCILFQSGDCDILITGDRGTLGEMLLVRRVELPKLELLIAGHHGSAGSTGELLLQETQPNTVIISVGKNNSYGMPAPSLLERLEKWGCTVYRTDQLGTIVFRG